MTDLDLSTTPLTNGFCSDNVSQLDPLSSQLLLQFVQISDAWGLGSFSCSQAIIYTP